ncbi:hypothetical protein EVAR_28588_1 [Eumeta japonica]|uniref:Protein ALP1-like n=1 Tax=Eumeta variegata TaxID=151549 RepID=A0A4C1UY57_EUMVA|nr:hypothetical protein EVAR_28588_1 [Eumeta japonica]
MYETGTVLTRHVTTHQISIKAETYLCVVACRDDYCRDAMKLLKSKKKKRRYWVHPINRGRQDKGEFHRLVRELESDDEKFHQYFRMNQAQYEEIHSLIEGDIKSTYEIS